MSYKEHWFKAGDKKCGFLLSLCLPVCAKNIKRDMPITSEKWESIVSMRKN